MLKIEWIKDVIGNNYIAVKIWHDLIYKEIQHLRIIEPEADQFILNQQKRDNNKYHITVVSVMEVDAIIKNKGMDFLTKTIDSLQNLLIDDIKLLGLGEASNSTSKSYFVVVESNLLNGIRHTLGLNTKDLHITVGFNPKDVFGVRKNKVIPKRSNFIKLFKSQFFNDESLNFLKNISNFNNELTGEIIPYQISESTLSVWIRNVSMVISDIDNELKVSAEWINNKKPTALTITEIREFINKN